MLAFLFVPMGTAKHEHEKKDIAKPIGFSMSFLFHLKGSYPKIALSSANSSPLASSN
jgi:hypothetical protein